MSNSSLLFFWRTRTRSLGLDLIIRRSGFCTNNIKNTNKKAPPPLDFTQIQISRLPTVIIIGRPNVGKSALFNRLIRRREALVYNTPDDHVTRDIREGVAKLGHLRFRVLDSAGLEAEATSGSILHRTASFTANVLSSSHSLLFLTDARFLSFSISIILPNHFFLLLCYHHLLCFSVVRAGLHPLDLEVGKWLRKNAPQVKPVLVMNKSESLFDANDSLASAANEMSRLGFGDPIAISAETGLGMHDLHLSLKPVLEDHLLRLLNGKRTSIYNTTCVSFELCILL